MLVLLYAFRITDQILTIRNLAECSGDSPLGGSCVALQHMFRASSNIKTTILSMLSLTLVRSVTVASSKYWLLIPIRLERPKCMRQL